VETTIPATDFVGERCL